MPADDATGPGGRAASIGFFAYADDTLRTVADDAPASFPDHFEPDGLTAQPPARSGSALIVAVATLLLAGAAFGVAWTVTGRGTPDARPPAAAAPAELPPEPQPLVAPPLAAAPAPRPTVHLAPRHSARPPLRPPAAPAHRRVAAAHRPALHAAAPRQVRAAPDLADLYARSIEDLDRRQALAALADPPY